ncbi:MAG: type III-A CRISPR-associated protein Cas10/Csm1 [Syntrophales bacterium]
MDRELQILVLSAILHDVGKFAQRANRPFSKEMESTYLTSYKGVQGHWHTLYSDYFIEKDLPMPEELDRDRGRIARIASAHHRPNENDLLEMCVTIADRLSSGAERINYHDTEGDTDFREARLLSIFEEIELKKHRFEAPGNWYHSLTPLEAASSVIFPVKAAKAGVPGEYEALFDNFLEAVKKLDASLPFTFYLDSLISIMERYTWCIPSSSYETLPDISLFDHAVTTASIAQGLYLFHNEKKTVPRWTDGEEKFLLLGGDLSGIQSYIFGISHNSGRGVSKIFRARSFYLHALVRSVLISIQRRFGLMPVCRILDAGGKFILLLPRIPSIEEQLPIIEGEIQNWFRRKYKGLLTLNLTWETLLTQSDFMMTKFQSKLDQVNETIDTAKLTKLKRSIGQSGPVIDEDYDELEGGNCAICNVNRIDLESMKKYKEFYDMEMAICRDCFQQIDDIGTDLPRMIFHVYGHAGRVELFDGIKISLTDRPPDVRKDVFLVETFRDGLGFARTRLARRIPRLMSEELQDERWYRLFDEESEGTPLQEDQPKTFGMIALKSKKVLENELVGRSLLGFLKADVDNLGFIFGLGLRARLSLARFSFLSRMVNLFFSDYLVALLEKDYPDVYIVFAGGDDVFLIGPWHQTLQFALHLRMEFSRFCAENSDLSLSAGVLVARPRYPIRMAAKLVEEYLKAAKGFKANGREKDAVTVLEEVITWDELAQQLDMGQKIDKAMEEKERTGFSMAFLYRLLRYHRMYKKFIKPEDGYIKAGRYLSHAHYDIGRNIMDKRKKNQKELEMLWEIFAVGGREKLKLAGLYLPLFYAINLNRKN